jgi:uncharacterized protein involved in outer membrane biogenesis
MSPLILTGLLAILIAVLATSLALTSIKPNREKPVNRTVLGKHVEQMREMALP